MDDATTLTAKVPAVRIGIRGLTHTKSMLGGSIYFLIAETTSARFPMLAGSVAGAFEDGLSCTLIVPGNTSQFMQRIERLARIDTAELIAGKRLQIFMTQDNFLKKMFQFGADRFVSELEDFGIPDDSYLIFDQADELLSLHDISLAQEQVNVLKEWFSKKRITALLVFSRFTDSHNNTVNAIMDSLGGIVRLGGARAGLELKFDYWQSPTSVIAAKNYQLETLDTGLYKASTKAASSDPLMDDEVEEENLTGRRMVAYENTVQIGTRHPAVGFEKLRGYLKPLDFMREVNKILEQMGVGNLSCVLVVGIPANGMIVSDIVRRFDRSSRLGELITVDDRQCYVYLNIDTKSDLQENLEIIFGLSVNAIFSQYRILDSLDEIRLELAALSYAVQLRSYPDFSSIHEIPVPLQISRFADSAADGVSRNSGLKQSLDESVSGINSQPSKKSESLDSLDFEPAKRSVSLSPIFHTNQEAMDDVVFSDGKPGEKTEVFFDLELDGPVYEKKEVPRAKRTLK
ncbi:MAG: BcsE family c-di-GMP-binding protein [Azonexus sp.]|jgi:hypothetical protein|uniref:BcsE family c-di-GMP-binding protein n=2 Tax=Hydrogenophaga sp. TaxID=1904254 RepID=UPI0027285EEA|nr:BcsE family c-di-GMP-binding protein [Hydrogenophaga sp.]MDO9480544.1 BcsE family c-di-GMP-binding protein [Hydrogenophaga sp.]MDO9604728.1 BcsE family c-di-GMP-binding protein [Hydrogenophaga sp.]MDZ4316267.1 BcsE family c-di-GMP-binding protein [Azonexus sp.]